MNGNDLSWLFKGRTPRYIPSRNDRTFGQARKRSDSVRDLLKTRKQFKEVWDE